MRALVLSGGGVKGAYQVGVLRHLLGELKTRYDVICGVSVGALNGAFLAQYPIGQEVKAYEALGDIWSAVNNKRIWKRWFPFGKLHALWKKSALNSEPLQKWVRSQLDPKSVRASGKKLRVGAVSLDSGEYKAFGEDFVPLPDAVLASSAFPGMFTPIKIQGSLWTDGGVRNITPLKEAIDLGAKEVDVIITSPNKPAPSFPKDPETLDIAERSIDLMSHEVLEEDLRVAHLYNLLVLAGEAPKGKRLVNLRVFRPATRLTGNSLDFSPSSIERMRDRGYKDAVQVCAGERTKVREEDDGEGRQEGRSA